LRMGFLGISIRTGAYREHDAPHRKRAVAGNHRGHGGQ
jgi:hypothetical protein